MNFIFTLRVRFSPVEPRIRRVAQEVFLEEATLDRDTEFVPMNYPIQGQPRKPFSVFATAKQRRLLPPIAIARSRFFVTKVEKNLRSTSGIGNEERKGRRRKEVRKDDHLVADYFSARLTSTSWIYARVIAFFPRNVHRRIGQSQEPLMHRRKTIYVYILDGKVHVHAVREIHVYGISFIALLQITWAS
ncbi:uncharacterized protein [Venturia canescens]|uniref:uncharacterized protein n=1 Tax=Venturia canescens TaxID=32260 RepID=UPI001C9D5A60|nr:uncharacterized protein LOC122405913 [Venturia canescens]